jgi:hypothetical protein
MCQKVSDNVRVTFRDALTRGAKKRVKKRKKKKPTGAAADTPGVCDALHASDQPELIGNALVENAFGENFSAQEDSQIVCLHINTYLPH